MWILQIIYYVLFFHFFPPLKLSSGYTRIPNRMHSQAMSSGNSTRPAVQSGSCNAFFIHLYWTAGEAETTT
jgi:hypothetical protein